MPIASIYVENRDNYKNTLSIAASDEKLLMTVKNDHPAWNHAYSAGIALSVDDVRSLKEKLDGFLSQT